MAIINGNDGNNALNGTNAADEIYGRGGNDTLVGRDGADLLEGGAGADEVFGSGGFDFASYRSSDRGILVDLGNFLVEGGHADGDHLYSIEGVIGSAFADEMWAVEGGNVFRGLGGNDSLNGSQERDVLEGGDGNDYLAGFGGNDTLSGGNGNDVLLGRSGNDDLRGGAGIDTADFYNFATGGGVVANLATGIAFGGPAFGNDRLFGIENLFGTESNDELYGNDGANVLRGHSDTDLLAGRGGADRFDFNNTSDSSPTARDIILDFSRAQGDKFDLAGIDAKVHATGNEAFTFIGQGQFTGEGQLRFFQLNSDTIIEANTDNSVPGADMVIVFDRLVTLQGGDFLL